MLEPAGGGDISSKSNVPGLTEGGKELIDKIRSGDPSMTGARNNARTVIGGATGGASDIEFDADGLQAVINIVKQAHAKVESARRSRDTTSGGWDTSGGDGGYDPVASTYNQKYTAWDNDKYRTYVNKLDGGFQKTIETLEQARKNYQSREEDTAQTFNGNVQ